MIQLIRRFLNNENTPLNRILRTGLEDISNKIGEADGKTLFDGIGSLNSNFDVPLNELLEPMYRRDEHILIHSTSETLYSYSGNNTTINGNMLLATFRVTEELTNITLSMGNFSTNNAGPVTMFVTNASGETVGSVAHTSSNWGSITIKFVDMPIGEYSIYITSSGSGVMQTGSKLNMETVSSSLVVSSEQYISDKTKTSLLNSSASKVALTELPRLDRCEFDWFVSGAGYTPNLIRYKGVDYVRYLPPYCVMRIKY